MPADREDDLPAGAGQLVGDLHAGRRGADDEHAAGRELRRVAVAAGVSTVSVLGRARRPGGHVRAAVRAGGDDDVRGPARCPGR